MLEVGGVMLGEVPTFRIDHMPYGGVKDSGLGRERRAVCDRGDDGDAVVGSKSGGVVREGAILG